MCDAAHFPSRSLQSLSVSLPPSIPAPPAFLLPTHPPTPLHLSAVPPSHSPPLSPPACCQEKGKRPRPAERLVELEGTLRYDRYPATVTLRPLPCDHYPATWVLPSQGGALRLELKEGRYRSRDYPATWRRGRDGLLQLLQPLQLLLLLQLLQLLQLLKFCRITALGALGYGYQGMERAVTGARGALVCNLEERAAVSRKRKPGPSRSLERSSSVACGTQTAGEG